jgi:hypothetical protein
MFRSFLLVVVAGSFVACGPDSLSSKITIGNEAELTKKGTTWFLTAPVQVLLPPTRADWRVTSSVTEETATNFIDGSASNDYELPAGATAFELPLRTKSDLKRGVRVVLKVAVGAHVWDGALGAESSIDVKTFNFMLQ